MKLSRRKIFGVAIGGAVAGPEMAKQAMNSVMSQGSTQLGGTGPSSFEYNGIDRVSGTEIKTLSQEDYLSKRKANLLKIINGEFEDYQKEELELLHRVNHKGDMDIQNFKSISNAHKQLMGIEHQRKCMIQDWQKKARKELELLAKGLFS